MQPDPSFAPCVVRGDFEGSSLIGGGDSGGACSKDGRRGRQTDGRSGVYIVGIGRLKGIHKCEFDSFVIVADTADVGHVARVASNAFPCAFSP